MCSQNPKYARGAQGVRSQATSSNPTTGFLTATTFIYALGAGITAGAGTRLVLQLLLDVGWF